MKVVVIGTGIVGASAAYHLAKNGIEVVMVDSDIEGRATSAGAGIVCPWDTKRGHNWYSIANAGALYYSTLISDLEEDGEADVGYKKVGALFVRSDSQKLEKIEERLRAKREKTPEVGDILKLTPTEACKLFPPLKEDFEAIYVSGAARVDGRLLRDALKRAAQKYKAMLVNGEATLLYENNRIIGVTVNGEKVHADSVLITAGAWAPSILKPLGIYLHVEPQRGQIAHIKLPGQDTSNWPVVLPENSHYMLAFDNGKIVAGATREKGSGFDYRVTAGGVHEVMSEALAIAPGLSNGTLDEMRVGFRPMGPDNLPLLGKIDSLKNVVLATGLGASGLTMGPYVGSLATSILKDEKLEMDISPYTPMRAITMGKQEV